MSRNRKIPFGYRMTEGIIETSPKEVPVVADIFNWYLEGKSLEKIARQLNLGNISYGNGTSWNKNKIKRILDNKTYLGDDKHPQIISENIYEKAHMHKQSKCTNNYALGGDIAAIKKIIYCKECGKKMTRLVSTGYWTCKNTACFRYDYTLTDQMIVGAVINVINTVIANPSLIQCSGLISEYAPSAIIDRHQKELQQKIDMPDMDYDRLKDEIISMASDKYHRCTYNDNIEATERIVQKLSVHDQINNLENDLLKLCVSRILASHFGTIEVLFNNGITIQNITERTDE